MATSNRQGYNPNRAGDSLLAFCQSARAELLSQLVRPPMRITEDLDAWDRHFQKINAINAMDHNELRAALQAARGNDTEATA